MPVPKDDSILSRFDESYEQGVGAHKEFFDIAQRSYDMYANKQWSAEDEAALKKEQRPALTFNQIRPIVDVIAGTEITSRFEPKLLPRTLEDTDWGSRLTEVVRYQRQQGDAEAHESYAFRDLVTTEIGCCEYSQQYTEVIEGRTVVSRVPMVEMNWDPTARAPNLRDRSWQQRGRWVTERDFEAQWGKELLEAVRHSASDRQPVAGGPEVHDQDRSDLYQGARVKLDTKLKRLPVWDFQWKETERRNLVTVPGQGGVVLDAEGLEEARERASTEGVELTVIKIPWDVYYRAFLAGDTVLSKEELRVRAYTYEFMTALPHHQDDGTVRWFGLVEGLCDPQSWANKMLSQLVHVVATNPKGAILAEEGMFANVGQARTDWGKPSPLIELRMGALKDKRIQIVEGRYPQQIERIMQIAIEALPRIAGVSPYFSSQVEDLRRTAQSAVSLIQRQGMVVLSPFFESLRLFRKSTGRLYLNFIREFMDEDTIFRITQGPYDQGEAMGFKREWVDRVEYDIVVDEAPVSPTASQEFWDSLMQTDALTPLTQMGLLDGEILADIMPNVPSSIRQKMKEKYFAAQQAAAQQAQQQGGAIQ